MSSSKLIVNVIYLCTYSLKAICHQNILSDNEGISGFVTVDPCYPLLSLVAPTKDNKAVIIHNCTQQRVQFSPVSTYHWPLVAAAVYFVSFTGFL